MSNCILFPELYIIIDNDYLLKKMLSSHLQFHKVMYLVLYPYFNKVIPNLSIIIAKLNNDQFHKIQNYTEKLGVHIRKINKENDYLLTWHLDYYTTIINMFQNNNILEDDNGLVFNYFIKY